VENKLVHLEYKKESWVDMTMLLELIGGIGEVFMAITPLTLVIGIINAIKKDGNSSTAYKIMAIISAYLIIIPLMINSI